MKLRITLTRHTLLGELLCWMLFRFGLPVNFQPILVVPHRKSERQLQSVLHRLFSYLDSTADPAGVDVSHLQLAVIKRARYHSV